MYGVSVPKAEHNIMGMGLVARKVRVLCDLSGFLDNYFNLLKPPRILGWVIRFNRRFLNGITALVKWYRVIITVTMELLQVVVLAALRHPAHSGMVLSCSCPVWYLGGHTATVQS